jgi:hypothetical protein
MYIDDRKLTYNIKQGKKKHCPECQTDLDYTELLVESLTDEEAANLYKAPEPREAESSLESVDTSPDVKPSSEQSVVEETTQGTTPEFQDSLPGVETPDGEIKPTKGREKKETYTGQVLDKKAAGMLLEMVFNAIAAKRGDFWKLTREEVDNIAPLLARIANKHLGSRVGKYGDEVTLGIALGVILIGRYAKDMDVNGKKKAEPVSYEQNTVVPVAVEPPKEETLLSEYPGLMR